LTLDTNSLNYDCDWRRGFNLDPAAKDTFGYLLFWSGCGGLSLARDIEVWNPFSGTGQTVTSGPTIQCVALIESFRFQGDQDSPIRITAYVSKETAANVRTKLANPVTATSVQVAWYVVGFDDDKKQWFEASFVKNNARAQANVDVSGGVLQMFIENQPVAVDPRLDIKVYKFEFQVVPSEGTSTLLEFATGSTQRRVVKWAAD
jgi:hypothetical protein